MAGRALARHDPTILEAGRFPELVQLSWQGLRAYLDNPVLLSALDGETAVDQVMRAVIDGGFESVLDEHFWLRAQNLQHGVAGFGRDIARFAQLKEQRMIYRLALGQPNQEDFLEVLSRGGSSTRALLQPLVLDLSAMGLRQPVSNGTAPVDAGGDEQSRGSS